MKRRIVNRSKHLLPSYSTEVLTGMDIRANIESEIVVSLMESILIPIGLFTELSFGYEAQIRQRSGLTIIGKFTLVNFL